MDEISAVNFLQTSQKNFEVDLKSHKIRSVTQTEKFKSDCGWDEGHEWHYEADTQPILMLINDSLARRIQCREVEITATEIDYPLESQGGSASTDPATRSESSIKLHLTIDLAQRLLTLK